MIINGLKKQLIFYLIICFISIACANNYYANTEFIDKSQLLNFISTKKYFLLITGLYNFQNNMFSYFLLLFFKINL